MGVEAWIITKCGAMFNSMFLNEICRIHFHGICHIVVLMSLDVLCC